MNKTKLAVLVSGGGTNLQAIIDAQERDEIRGEIAVVISSRKKAFAIQRAERHNLPCCTIRPRDFHDTDQFTQAIIDCLRDFEVDLVVLAGFMSILGSKLIAEYRNRIMNIHPALLPAFGGDGMYGHHVHEAVLTYGCKVSGATVMFVDEGVDTGPIILQATVPVLPCDTPEVLGKRVLQEEHRIYKEAIKLYCQGRLKVEGRLVRVSPKEKSKWK